MTVNGLTVLIAAAVVIAWFLGARAALRRWDGSHDPQTPRRFPSSLGAWGTRARRSAMRSAYRRAGTTWGHARDWARAEWAGLGDTGPPDGGGYPWDEPGMGPCPGGLGGAWHDPEPPADLPDGGGPLSPAPVRQPALPNRGDAQEREGGCAPPESRPAAGADLTGLLSPRQVLQRQDLNQEGPRAASAPPSVATRPPTRLATDAERRWYLTTAERDAAPLDYAPAPPFATVLSPDTLARGIPAVKP